MEPLGQPDAVINPRSPSLRRPRPPRQERSLSESTLPDARSQLTQTPTSVSRALLSTNSTRNLRPTEGGRASLIRAKRTLADYTAESSKKRLVKDDLENALLIIKCRKELGTPITMDTLRENFPENLADLLNNPKESDIFQS